MTDENRFWGNHKYIKNTRDDVINLKGEIRNPSQQDPVTVTSVATQITASTNKRILYLTNTGVNDCFLGDTNVTSSNGTPLLAGESFVFDNIKDLFTVFAITSDNDTTLRILEF